MCSALSLLISIRWCRLDPDGQIKSSLCWARSLIMLSHHRVIELKQGSCSWFQDALNPSLAVP